MAVVAKDYLKKKETLTHGYWQVAL